MTPGGTAFPLYEIYINPAFARARIYTGCRRTLAPIATIGVAMADIIFLLLGVGFFAGAILYAYACDRL